MELPDPHEFSEGLGHDHTTGSGDDAAAPAPVPVAASPAAPKPPVLSQASAPVAAPAALEKAGPDARALVQQGLAARTPLEALELFRRAHARDLNDPMAMSYHGMALATAQGHYQQGIVFCEEAVRRMGPNPDLLVNLARAYLAAKNKREAVRALRRALARATNEGERVRAELAALGLRRTPPIAFLPRSFFLNKLLGAFRHWLLHRRAPADDGQSPIPAELGQLSGDVESARAQLAERHDPPDPAT